MENQPVGKRLVFSEILLERLTVYEKIMFEKPCSVWRHQFRCRKTNQVIVYSGKWLGLKQGQICTIKGTIKLHDEKWKQTRIKFPKVILPVDNPMMI